MGEVTGRRTEARPRRFHPYPEHRGSGVECLGEIPVHWRVKRLKFAAQTVAGQSPPSAAVTDGVDGLPFLQGNAEFGPLSPTPRHVCDSAPKRAEAGDILLSVRAPVGAMNLADQTYGIGRGLCAIRPTAATDRPFCFYGIMAIRSLLDAVGKGSTYDAVTASDVGDLPMLLPHPDEQHEIAAFLDRETAKIDALVAKKERLVELLQEKRTALITRAVTRGLGTNVPMKDSGVQWLGEIPAHWKGKKIKRLFAKTKLQGFPELTVLSVYRDYGVIKKSSRDDNFNRTPEDLSTYQVVNPGDLVINKMKAWQGSLGISSLSGITSPDYVVYLPHHQEERRFLHHFLRCKLLSSVYVTMSNGIRPNQWRLEPERFEELEVSLPPPDEQGQIAEFLDRETAKVDALVAKVRQAINHLNEYRTALISAAVTGKIDVRQEAT